jgi:hypothetical protein
VQVPCRQDRFSSSSSQHVEQLLNKLLPLDGAQNQTPLSHSFPSKQDQLLSPVQIHSRMKFLPVVAALLVATACLLSPAHGQGVAQSDQAKTEPTPTAPGSCS